ncbi:MAG TPA: right-handed parallel beta-helix repeat-containing protein [Tahibacter sp.]|nr:right-handed parallel beta-helix repeat-containing protein [Tahibacter sp.]
MKIQSQPYSAFFAACKALAFVLLAAVTVWAPAAVGATFCVSSTIALDAALAHFEDEDDDTTIRLVRGSYFIQGATNDGGSADLTIVGGYDAGCESRSLDPTLTVLRPNQSDAMELQAKNLQLESVTVRDVSRSVFFVAYGTTFSNGRLTLGRVRFEGPTTAGNVMLGEEVFISQVHVEHSGATSPTNFTNCALTVDGMDDADDSVVIQHSTIVDNPSHGLCVNPELGTGDLEFALYLDNNVIYGSPQDVQLGNTSNWVVRNNMYASFASEIGAASPGASGNNLQSNPLFVNPGAGDYRLQAASPAVNSGRTAPQGGLPQLDIVGNSRWIGTAPDRGAYESSFDNAQAIVVTSTADTNTTGTLRWALNQANASPGYSVIRFNIPGACPRVIIVDENLPAIVTPVGIDGYSQPGSHPNTLTGGVFGRATDALTCVLVTSSGVDWGLRVPAGANNGQLGVSGLAIGGFTQAAISIEAGAGSSIVGNEIRAPQPIGIFVGGSASGTQIGGPDPWQTNVIRSNEGYGIALNPSSTNTRVENNLVGIEANGNEVTVGNTIGIGISASDNTIVDNAIAGSDAMAIQITGSRNLVRGNVLGRKVGFVFCPIGTSCNAELANGSHGVLIQGDATGNTIDGNVIANSGGHGICATSGQRNLFLANRIWNSGQLGIDLGDNGNDAANNDTDPGEAGKPNRGINPPIQGTARGGERSGSVTGLMQTINGRYLMQAFMSNDCAHEGQGQWFVGYTVVDIADATPTANGRARFAIPIRSVNPQPAMPGKFITIAATQIDAGGYGHSSEMSRCTPYSDDTIFKDDFE